jgi:hypothetical protein
MLMLLQFWCLQDAQKQQKMKSVKKWLGSGSSAMSHTRNERRTGWITQHAARTKTISLLVWSHNEHTLRAGIRGCSQQK